MVRDAVANSKIPYPKPHTSLSPPSLYDRAWKVKYSPTQTPCSQWESCDMVLDKEMLIKDPREGLSAQTKRQRLPIRKRYGLECRSDAWRSSSYLVTVRTNANSKDGWNRKSGGARVPDDIHGLLFQFWTPCLKLLFAHEEYTLCLFKPL